MLEHLARVDRVLSQDGGHLLLAGRSGVGRRSATTLVAYMLGFHFVTPMVSNTTIFPQYPNPQHSASLTPLRTHPTSTLGYP